MTEEDKEFSLKGKETRFLKGATSIIYYKGEDVENYLKELKQELLRKIGNLHGNSYYKTAIIHCEEIIEKGFGDE